MAAGCVGDTPSVSLGIDGAGTLHASSRIHSGFNQPILVEADGLSVRPSAVTWGWPFAGDDTFNAPAGVAPQFGPLVYGPEFACITQTASVGQVIAIVNWECQVGFTGLNTFSGITFELQLSYDHVNWAPIATQGYYQPATETILHHFNTTFPVQWADNGAHNVWFRLVLTAGSFGTGDVATAQFSRRRGITFLY